MNSINKIVWREKEVKEDLIKGCESEWMYGNYDNNFKIIVRKATQSEELRISRISKKGGKEKS